MKQKNAEAIVEHLKDECGHERDRVVQSYSGRGMCGATTSGVVTDDPDDVAYAMGALGIDDSRRQDSMGRRYIVY